MSKSNKEAQSVVQQKVLHELFDYNGTTGRWLNKTNRRRARAGQSVGCVNKSTGYVVIWINGRLH